MGTGEPEACPRRPSRIAATRTSRAEECSLFGCLSTCLFER